MMQDLFSKHENTFSPLTALLGRMSDTTKHFGPAFGHHGARIDELNQRFSEGRFHLAVLGQFKRGKSTLLNALTGKPVLPVGVVPLTAIPTFIRYAETPKITIQFQDNDETDCFSGGTAGERSSYLARFVTEEGNPKNTRKVREVQVELPASILAGGVVLIDTPGIGSTYRHNTQATLDFLKECDAALFLISADPPITEAEIGFLQEVREKIPRLFFVMNKIDYLDDDELEKALAFYKTVLKEQAAWTGDSQVFCVSAKNGLKAVTSGDSGLWSASGMAGLESFLVDFLVREKKIAFADAVTLRACDLAETVLMEARISMNALTLPLSELEEKAALFEKSMKQAEKERTLIQDVLDGDKRRVIRSIEDEAEDLRGTSRTLLKSIMDGGNGFRSFGSSHKDDIEKSWAETIPVFFQQAQAEMNEKVKERLLNCLSPHEERLTELVETLRETAASLFQVSYRRPLGRDEVFEIKRRPYWVLNTWNADALPMLKSTEQRLDELVLRNVENIRWNMLQNLNVSFAKFARRVKERIDETVFATKGAIESANERRKACGGSVEEDVARIAGLIETMETLKSEMESMRNSLPKNG